MHQYLYNLKRTSVVALQKTDTDHYLKLEGWIKSSQVYGPYRKDGLGNHSCVFVLLAKFPLQRKSIINHLRFQPSSLNQTRTSIVILLIPKSQDVLRTKSPITRVGHCEQNLKTVSYYSLSLYHPWCIVTVFECRLNCIEIEQGIFEQSSMVCTVFFTLFSFSCCHPEKDAVEICDTYRFLSLAHFPLCLTRIPMPAFQFSLGKSLPCSQGSSKICESQSLGYRVGWVRKPLPLPSQRNWLRDCV